MLRQHPRDGHVNVGVVEPLPEPATALLHRHHDRSGNNKCGSQHADRERQVALYVTLDSSFNEGSRSGAAATSSSSPSVVAKAHWPTSTVPSIPYERLTSSV